MSDRSPLRGPATVVLHATDVDAAARWYAELCGVEPYFRMPEAPAPAAYVEFRVGDDETELGIQQASFHPTGAPPEPAGVIVNWAVDDLDAVLADVVGRGARVVESPTDRGSGFVTSVVVDPFGNLLGLMRNPHYAEVHVGRA